MCMTVVITAFALVYFIFAVGLPILAAKWLPNGSTTGKMIFPFDDVIV